MSAPVVYFLFFLSGAAALIYQTAWQRILALGSGVGVYSVAMIVGAFMAGLGLGSRLAGSHSAEVTPRRALRLFGYVELGIGAFGALSPWLLYDLLYLRAGWLYAAPWRAGLAHLVTLLPPTVLMGMSLPYLVRGTLRSAAQASRTIGSLYGINVLGAASGALLTPWLLARLFGLRGAIAIAAAANVVVGLGALWFAARERDDGSALAPEPLDHEIEPAGSHPLGLWLALYAASGFVALALEMLWFRIVDVAVKSSAFTFGTVLALYLLGCGAGSLVGARRAKHLARPLRAFLFCQSLLVLVSALTIATLVWLPPRALGPLHEYWRLYEGVTLGESGSTSAALWLYVGIPVGLFGVPTFLMGLTFPILQRAVHDDVRTSGRKVGWLQAANIGGCVLGSFLVGLLALDRIGTAGTLRFLCLLAAGFAVLGLRRGSGGDRASFAALAAILILTAAAFPTNQALWARLHGWSAREALIGEDASGVSSIFPEGGGRRFRVSVNGKGISNLPFGSVHSFLGAIPALVHEAPEDVAVIGLGSGDTAWAAGCRSETRHLAVFELLRPQPRLLRELLRVYPYEPLRSFLDDPRLRLVLDDGRSRLAHEARSYDLVEADALRPRSAGSGNVYSVEFFEACGRKLKPGGVVCTWAPTPRVHASFAQVFPHVLSFVADGESVLVGSKQPLAFDRGAWRARLETPRVQGYFGPVLSAQLLRILRAAQRGHPAAQGRVQVNTDLFPRDELLAR